MGDRREIGRIVAALAEYYDKVLSATQLAMYVEDLLDLDAEQLTRAVREYRQDPKNDRFPLPAKLKALIRPPETLDAEAREAAARVITAVSRCGPYQPALAREYVGSLGWEIVKQQGGWLAVCEMLSSYDVIPTLQAQWRDLAMALGRRARIGSLSNAPELPAPSQAPKGELRRIGMGMLPKPEGSS